jgi:DNA-binding transcriptional regulator YiaG
MALSKRFFRRWFMKRKYKSEILKVIHEDAVGNFEVGAIDSEKMKEFDDLCLEKETTAGTCSTGSKSARLSVEVYAAGQ